MTPTICQFYLTLECNAFCEFCSIWSDQSYKDDLKYKPAKIEQTLSFLEKIKDEGIDELRITGGEPMLYDDLALVLTKAKNLKLKVSLFTNALLYRKRAKEIKGLIEKLYFSLDYPYKDLHDRSRGRNIFNEFIRAIEAAIKEKEEPIILYTLTRDSVLYLPEANELCDRFGLKLQLNPVYDFFGMQGFEKETIDHIKYFSKKEHVFANLAMLEFIKSRGNNIAWTRCRAKQTVLTVLPSLKRVEPCFYNQGGRQGKETVCIGCMRWPYILPSFKIGFDKYRLFDWLSHKIWERRNKK